MRYNRNASLIIFIGVLVLGFNNCSNKTDFHSTIAEKIFRSGETVVGNPMTTAAKTVSSKICNVLTRCHSQLSREQCEVSLQNVSGIDFQLGLSQGSYANFSAIQNAEEAGLLQANSSAAQSCFSAIENLSCSEAAVQKAFDPVTKSLAGVAFMIPTAVGSCPWVFNQPPQRNEYFIATQGSDTNDGSANRPWATLNHAAANLKTTAEGAIVHVAPGTYTVPVTANCSSHGASCGVSTHQSGQFGAPIIYISDIQGAAKITAPGASAVWYNDGNHVHIVGFEIEGSPTSNFGILSEASFGQVIGNHIHSIPVTSGCATNFAGGGIFFGYLPSAHDNDAIANRIHHIGPQVANGLPTSAYCAGMANGITYNQPRGKVQNNIIFNVDSWGISTWRLAAQLDISHNLLFDNGSLTDNSTRTGGAIFISAEAGVGIHNDSTISNNIIRNNSGKGINEWGSVGNQNAYINNLMYLNGTDFSLQSGVTPIGTISADPLMIQFNLDGSGNYQLQAQSPALDSGSKDCAHMIGSAQCLPSDSITGFIRPLGGGFDIGPFEMF